MDKEANKKSKSYTLYTAEAILLRTELAFTGSRADPEILSAMGKFSYDSASLDAVEAQWNEARAFVLMVQQARAAQKDATKMTTVDFKTLKVLAADLAVTAREVLKGDAPALAALGLTGGSQPQALGAFLLYADKLYGGALTAPTDVQERLAKRGYTFERLKKEREMIAQLRASNEAQEQAKGTSQDLTPQQNKRLADLNDWTMTYRKLARRALRERPQLLEKLGIKATSSRI